MSTTTAVDTKTEAEVSAKLLTAVKTAINAEAKARGARYALSQTIEAEGSRLGLDRKAALALVQKAYKAARGVETLDSTDNSSVAKVVTMAYPKDMAARDKAIAHNKTCADGQHIGENLFYAICTGSENVDEVIAGKIAGRKPRTPDDKVEPSERLRLAFNNLLVHQKVAQGGKTVDEKTAWTVIEKQWKSYLKTVQK